MGEIAPKVNQRQLWIWMINKNRFPDNYFYWAVGSLKRSGLDKSKLAALTIKLRSFYDNYIFHFQFIIHLKIKMIKITKFFFPNFVKIIKGNQDQLL